MVKSHAFVLKMVPKMVPIEVLGEADGYDPYYRPYVHKRAFSIEDFDPETFDKLFKRGRNHFRPMFKRSDDHTVVKNYIPIFRRTAEYEVY